MCPWGQAQQTAQPQWRKKEQKNEQDQRQSQKNDQNKEQKNEQENEQTEAQPELGVLWVSDNGSCYHRDRMCAALAHANLRKKTQCSKCFRAKRE